MKAIWSINFDWIINLKYMSGNGMTGGGLFSSNNNNNGITDQQRAMAGQGGIFNAQNSQGPNLFTGG